MCGAATSDAGVAGARDLRGGRAPRIRRIGGWSAIPPGGPNSLAPYIAPYAERAQIAVLGGSVAQGVADRWSDIDTLVYWDAIDRDRIETPRAAAGGERFTWVEDYPGNACLEQYRFGTVEADVAHVRLGWLDELIDGVLSGETTGTRSLDVSVRPTCDGR